MSACIDCNAEIVRSARKGPTPKRCASCKAKYTRAYLAQNFPPEYHRARNEERAEEQRSYRKAFWAKLPPEEKARRYAHTNAYKLAKFERNLLYGARRRAMLSGLPCDLELEDIVIPEVCPVFGMPLEKSGGLANPNLASLDRLEPSLGYVKGNVWVISWRANKLKSDASVADLNTLVSAINAKKSTAA